MKTDIEIYMNILFDLRYFSKFSSFEEELQYAISVIDEITKNDILNFKWGVIVDENSQFLINKKIKFENKSISLHVYPSVANDYIFDSDDEIYYVDQQINIAFIENLSPIMMVVFCADDYSKEGIVYPEAFNIIYVTPLNDSVVVYHKEKKEQVGFEKIHQQLMSLIELAQQYQCDKLNIKEPNNIKKKLAYVSPIPPERTGIADYSADLIPVLEEYYDITIIVDQESVSYNGPCAIHKVDWFISNHDEFDRILYHVGNAPFHKHMTDLIKIAPGVVVMHDFYLGHLYGWISHNYHDSTWSTSLYRSHGYLAVDKRYKSPEETLFSYPCNYEILNTAIGVISHSDYSRTLAKKWYPSRQFAWSVIPLLRKSSSSSDKILAKKQLGFSEQDIVICSFGFLGETKLNHRLIDAISKSVLELSKNIHLVFVGENPEGSYGELIKDKIRQSTGRITITGFASNKLFDTYLSSADIAVQLRSKSRGESSAAVLDCMNYGIPTIVNANGSMAELPQDCVVMLPDDFTDDELASSIEHLINNKEYAENIGIVAKKYIHAQHSPEKCANQYFNSIENLYRQQKDIISNLVDRLVTGRGIDLSESVLHQLSKKISLAVPESRPKKTVYIDITGTYLNDLKTGIERVARALLISLIKNDCNDYRFEPVFLTDEGGAWHYKTARKYTLELLGDPIDGFGEEVVNPISGDIIIGLDYSGGILIETFRSGLFEKYRRFGTKVYFMLYDILPITMPHVFPPDADKGFSQWLEMMPQADGVVCISEAVACEYRQWLINKGVYENLLSNNYKIFVSHLGADLNNSAPSKGFPPKAEHVIKEIKKRRTFLMVGTIEPRKAHLQVIEAFTHLWNSGIDVNLVIVGHEGWKQLPNEMRRDIPEVINTIKHHNELGRRLFWLNGISDEYLEKIYSCSTCLIAASYGEGFGLPLIEAAQHNIPILARDLLVFREVAGEHAFYFSVNDYIELSNNIRSWIDLRSENKHPSATALRFLTWDESAKNMLNMLL